MYSPLGPRKQISIDAMEACQFPTSKEIQPSAGKVMATNFCDFEGLHLVDYLPSKKTTTGQYYAEIMFKLCDTVKQKRWGNCHRVFGFFTTMRPVHKSLVAKQAVCDCGFLHINPV